MNDSNIKVILFASLVSSTPACLDLGTQTPGSGGSGGMDGSGGNGAMAGGGGSPPVCTECTFGRRFGDDAEQSVYALAMGDEGSVFLSGTYNGNMFLGPNVGIADGNGDLMQAFLAKLDRQGVPQWIVTPDGFGSTSGFGASVAVTKGVVAWGGNIGDDPILRDMFIEVRALEGDSAPFVKTKLGSQWHDELTSIAVSSDGKTVFAAGVLHGNGPTYSGCPQMGPFDAGSHANVVVFSLDTATLSCKWGKTFTGSYHNPGTIRIAVAANGHPVVTGAYTGGTLDGTGLPTGDGAFVMKLDSGTGAVLRAEGFPNVLPLALTADASTDRIVVAGVLTGALTFAGKSKAAPIAPDTTDILVLAYDGMLNEKWLQVLAGPEDQLCQGISTDGAGRLYAGCIQKGTLNVSSNGNIDCPGPTFCGLLVTLASADGALFDTKLRTFGNGQPSKPGGTFLTAASAAGLVVGGSWIVPITFFDGMPLPPIGANTDYDVTVGKVEPAP